MLLSLVYSMKGMNPCFFLLIFAYKANNQGKFLLFLKNSSLIHDIQDIKSDKNKNWTL